MDERLPKFPTLSQVAHALQTGEGIERVPGRTLPKGRQWAGHDIPGRGKAAQRRLRQIARGHHAGTR